MRIGVDASRLAIHEKTGTEQYSFSLLAAMLEQDQKNEYFFYARPGLSLPGIFADRVRVIPIHTKHFWTHMGLSRRMLAHRSEIDVLFIPSHAVPLIHHPRTVVTTHGMEYVHTPDCYMRLERLELALATRFSAHAARHIIAVSEYTKQDLMQHLGIAPRKITVIPHGTPPDALAYAERSRAPMREPHDPMFVFVGRRDKRKNLPRVLDAFDRVLVRHPRALLVIIGKEGNDVAATAHARTHAQCRVENHIPRERMFELVSRADALVFPSLAEGFGIPILEAMALRVPVITSRGTACAEVAGNAALLVDPYSVEDIAENMLSIVEERHIREGLLRNGMARARAYRMEDTARATLAVLQKTAEH